MKLINKVDTKNPLLLSLLFACLFAISYSQDALYTTNQNTYLLHGLAAGSWGNLANDWMANTLDPFPLFSLLTYFTYVYISPVFFHIYQFLLLSLFIYSALKIITLIFNIDESLNNFRYLSFITLALLSYSFLISFVSYKVLGINLRELWADGVASQRLLGNILQPSVFGVFLLFSIYKFLKKRIIQAIIFLAVSIWFHPTYLFTGAILTLSYMIIIYIEEEDYKKITLTGILSFVLVVPVLYYNLFFFGISSSETSGYAQNILINYRIPHHAIVRTWFDWEGAVKVLLIIFALIITKKNKVFYVILIPFIGSLLLTFIQIFTESKFLALIFPWRVSVVLVPLSFFIITGWLVSLISKKIEHRLNRFNINVMKATSFIIVLACAVIGSMGILVEYKKYNQENDNPMVKYAASTTGKNNVFLIPPDLFNFRLATGEPVFVDKKTHPYKDIEVIDWYERMQIAAEFYATANQDLRCELLNDITTDYEITHIVTEEGLTPCPMIEEVYTDEDYFVYKIKKSGNVISKASMEEKHHRQK